MPLADKYIGKNSWLAARCLGDEMIIMSAKDSTLFTLNPSAAAIWEAADGVTPLSRMVENGICAEFEVGLPQALADAEQIVSDLAAHGILVISDQPIASQ